MLSQRKSGVLVLDNDGSYAKTLAEKLGQHGILSTHATDANTAIEMIRGGDYSVLLSEIWLPGKTGFQLTQELRETQNSHPEIILMSQDPKVSLFECHQAGACYLIRKPVNFDELGFALKRFGNIDQIASESTHDSTAALGRLYGQIRVTKKKQEFPVEVSNLGRGGFFCKTAPGLSPPPVGQVVDFNIRLGMVPDCECTGRGIIRWNYQTMLGDRGVGIEFLKIPEWFHQVAWSFADLFKVKEYIPNA